MGGVEKVSPSGDGGNGKAEGMVMVEGKERALCLYVFGGLHPWFTSHYKQHLQTDIDNSRRSRPLPIQAIAITNHHSTPSKANQ